MCPITGSLSLRITHKVSRVSHLLVRRIWDALARQGIEYSYHAAGAMLCTCLVHLHGINTLYHAMLVYMGMQKTLETLETLVLRTRVSKPVSTVLYILVYLHCMV